MISVDYELEINYKTDVVYFGTVSGDWSGGGGWGGGMYRLVTREMDSFTGNQLVTQPSDWATLISPTNPKLLIDAGRPVTAAASVGTDGANYWVYFGTGRFFDSDDKTDSSSNAQETYYGIKEPRDGNEFTWPRDCFRLTISWFMRRPPAPVLFFHVLTGRPTAFQLELLSSRDWKTILSVQVVIIRPIRQK